MIYSKSAFVIVVSTRQVGRSGVDRASSSDARGLGFEPWPLRFKKIPLLYPETLEVPIRGRVQSRILELGEEAGEQKNVKNRTKYLATISMFARL